MTQTDTYPWLERLFYKTAFKAILVQKALAEIEDRIFFKQLASISIDKPVFITSLPRAGTTLLLEILSQIPIFASHTYRDMPFVCCPIFWDKVSRPYHKKGTLRERAHGDGMNIDYDSPEAFEEIIWMTFWPTKYTVNRILPWTTEERQANFEEFFRNHIRKIISLRSSTRNGGYSKRYLSKNNANIARLDFLRMLLPDCRIIIPVRNPWDHVKSLREQHARFSAIHARDRFSREYMDWIGHYEFGAGLRPIDFGRWMDAGVSFDPFEDIFWVMYWVKAYEAILAASSPNIYFFNYDRACEEPSSSLKVLGDALELEDPEELLLQGSRFRKPKAHATCPPNLSLSLRARVEQVYENLVARSI